MGKVLVFGSFVVDLMARSSHLPTPGETVRGSLFKMGPGGKGFNQCVAAHKAGADVKMITKLGSDTFANIALDTMTELEMSQDYVFISETEKTGCALILVDEATSQNEIIIVPGACDTFIDSEIQSLENEIKDSEYLLLQLEVNQDANEKIADIANKYGCKVIVNTAPYSKLSDSFFSKVYMVTPNEIEAEEITGVPVTDLQSAHKAAEYFYDRGVKKVIITLGSKGVFVSSDGTETIVPAYHVNAVDTTGAGDAFNGGLLAALSKGKDIWEAVQFANALAALSVQKLGTTPAMPLLNDINRFIEENPI